MKVQWFRSATVSISSNSGAKILCDPWITDGAFIGSWFHFPPLEGFEFDYLANEKWDAIYISHLHADHFDRKLVSAIARNNPDCIAIVPKFKHDWLARAVENCGFDDSRLLELEDGNTYKIKDIDVTVFRADACNPAICGVQIPCHSENPRETSIDSVALFAGDKQRILNANDALAVSTVERLWPIIGKIDLLLGHYGGAGPFPQSFINLTPEAKKESAERTANAFVSRLIRSAESVSARYVMPYAGQYLLGGNLTELNDFRSVMPLSKVLDLIKTSSKVLPVSIAPFAIFDLEVGRATEEWREPSHLAIEAYKERIKSKLFPYQLREEKWENSDLDVFNALTAVADEYLKRVRNGSKLSFHSYVIKSELSTATLNLLGNEANVRSNHDVLNASYTELEFDSRLLKRLILRKPNYQGFTQFHFNQAEIGSHIKWSRTGEYDESSSLLNFMQTQKTG